ncbi:uncharacterized protein SPPG_01823 [Spizellomyces punctatus DAOM BR117]|uniref:Uncharacterized protein n=1 Tax=Spizellomyces punctatus (strain DAOM BR117) TaxID=645134 RepID=A0A0L0HP49_SPIPD|nr:uncharacterized protein SPPG_01823 [Spizellomyces punctatus DAOM BR117]KND02740.1 hypothetical protein SPPG_01823 [Spizellomyces punctatus DAOM BR117]|eukprot:XP_016610779.1 hypothetical protein SPPG_01823 [Spizellomyces punctatus DAOM BR117]
MPSHDPRSSRVNELPSAAMPHVVKPLAPNYAEEERQAADLKLASIAKAKEQGPDIQKGSEAAQLQSEADRASRAAQRDGARDTRAFPNAFASASDTKDEERHFGEMVADVGQRAKETRQGRGFWGRPL